MSRYHLWFLQMIVGIYMLLPILKKWLANASRKNVEYFLLLFLIFQVVRETIYALERWPFAVFLMDTVRIDMVCGYLGYFVLGYYIAHYGIDKRWHKWIYAGGIIGAVANILLGNVLAISAGIAKGNIYDSFGVFTFMMVVALFFILHREGQQGEVFKESRRTDTGAVPCNIGYLSAPSWLYRVFGALWFSQYDV